MSFSKRIAIASILIAGSALSFSAPVGASTGSTHSNNVKCTITGTQRNDVLRGTNRNDVICGLGGNDRITGLGGNDTLIGGPGRDTLDGGVGHDLILGGEANDSLTGGAGNDLLSGESGVDTLVPGSGSNLCQPGDTVVGQCGIDLAGPAISDVIVPTAVRAGERITFEWNLSDPAGIQFTGVTVGWANGLFTDCGFGQPASLISGTNTQGRWSFSCDIPTNAVATEYSVQVTATDGFGTYASSNWATFEVEGANNDVSPPTWSDIAVSSDASLGGEVTFTWTASDASNIGYGIMWVAGPGGYGFVDANGRSLADYSRPVEKVCNEEGSVCSFRQVVRLSQTGQPGQWVLWISTADVWGNKALEQVFTFDVIASSN